MAAAEARAAWQRANRYFVQEDAKRAPKLASRQPSNSSSKQADLGPVNASDRPDHSTIGFMPFNGSSYSNLPPDAKWWLHMQPNYVHQKDLKAEQFHGGKIDAEPSVYDRMESYSEVEPSTMCEDSLHSVNYDELESFLDVKKHPELSSEKLNIMDSKIDRDFLDVKNMTDYYELLDMEMVGCPVSKQSSDVSSSADSSWIGGEKVPWWRVTDEEELASFVAHKSLLHIENCDLPPPQKMKHVKSMDHDEILMASLEHEAISSPYSGCSGSQSRYLFPVEGGLSQSENLATEPLRSSNLETQMKRGRSVDDLAEAKLLEALCHSQTRARQAEKAAEQAFTEKEHILKLFFRQASELFAYKQWVKILQLENLLLTENQNPSPSSSLPDQLPWMNEKTHTIHKSWQKSSKANKRKRGSHDNDIGKYVVAFALGFTLVGAGLLLGWTAGCFLPAF